MREMVGVHSEGMEMAGVEPMARLGAMARVVRVREKWEEVMEVAGVGWVDLGCEGIPQRRNRRRDI